MKEAARLQGLPDWFDFRGQTTAASFKQLGNGVNIPAVYHALKALVNRDGDLLGDDSPLLTAISRSPLNPDETLAVKGQ